VFRVVIFAHTADEWFLRGLEHEPSCRETPALRLVIPFWNDARSKCHWTFAPSELSFAPS